MPRIGQALGFLALLAVALLVASTVASSAAVGLIDGASALGWWALVMVAWPVVLFVASRYGKRA